MLCLPPLIVSPPAASTNSAYTQPYWSLGCCFFPCHHGCQTFLSTWSDSLTDTTFVSKRVRYLQIFWDAFFIIQRDYFWHTVFLEHKSWLIRMKECLYIAMKFNTFKHQYSLLYAFSYTHIFWMMQNTHLYQWLNTHKVMLFGSNRCRKIT